MATSARASTIDPVPFDRGGEASPDAEDAEDAEDAGDAGDAGDVGDEEDAEGNSSPLLLCDDVDDGEMSPELF